MSEQPARRPVDLALEAFVYVPVGLAVAAKELLPKLAQRGRERITGQVTQARVVGQFAVHQVQAGKVFTPARPVQPRPVTSGPGSSELAIPGYDSLSASQVLPRLVALTGDELEAVRAYEAAHRGRKTILGRISQIETQAT